MLETTMAVERALRRYTDPFQPKTSSVTTLGGRPGSFQASPFHPGLLDDLDERAELRRRMAWLPDEEAIVLVRWYVEGARPEVIAEALGCSVRHVYRRRATGLAAVVEMGCRYVFADADVAEFA
jgi:DNA-directed RNA polymerase specialized sigma24 family protein